MTLPQVTVLLATYNGLRWLPEQLTSILDQAGVSVEVVVSDDGSTDGTVAWLAERAAVEPRLRVLPAVRPTGRAADNFYRLLRDVDLEGRELIALSDQDDVWLPGKLASQVELVRGGADGVSSDVVSFHEDGTRTLIRKSYPQRRFDYLFEGPGPGCSFLLSQRLTASVQLLLREESSPASAASFHDWLIYAVCRAQGWTWQIMDTPTLDYRQHSANSFGANTGVRSARHRLGLVKQGWHREEAARLSRLALEVADPSRVGELQQLGRLLEAQDLRARLALVRWAPQMRRRRRDQVLLAGLVVTGLW